MESISKVGAGTSLTEIELDQRFKAAQARRSTWESMWEDCIDYCMPARQSFFDKSIGQERTDRVFDETPITATAEFASRMQAAIMPPGRRWFRLEVSELVPLSQRIALQAQLDPITEFLYAKIQQSNLDAEVHESFMDIAIGTAAMHVTLNKQQKLVFRTSPLPTVWIEEAADGKVGAVFRQRESVELRELQAMYPEARLPKSNVQAKYCVREATIRANDPNEERWHYRVWLSGYPASTLREANYSGWGSCPWVVPRWAETPDEWYGRGPLINLLPAIRSVNLLRELIFENAEMAIGGVWQYPDDGTINPEQIQIAPNTFIPKTPGSSGLEPLVSPARFDVAQANLEDLRATIKRGLFSEDYTPTGRTPLSAMEIAARQTDLANRIGSPFSRILSEMVAPLIARAARLYADAGVIEIPKIDGEIIKVTSVSPLARAQKAEDIQRTTGFVAMLTELIGPEATGTYIKDEETVQYMSQLYEYPADLLHDNDSRVAQVQRNTELQKQMQESAALIQPQSPTRQIIEKGPLQDVM